jgi:hypothetical protein
MSKDPVVAKKQGVVRERAAQAVEVVEPARNRGPFLSFSYSCTEVSAFGGKTHVKSRKARFEDGTLTSETFEGELERGAYEQMVSQARDQFADQAALLLRPLSWWLPWRRPPSERD